LLFMCSSPFPYSTLFRSGDDGLRERAHDGELVAEVGVERLEPVRQHDGGVAVGVGGDVAAVDVEHLARLDGEMVEVTVLGVEGVDRKSTRLNSSHVKISY